jgi:hypothetical protein
MHRSEVTEEGYDFESDKRKIDIFYTFMYRRTVYDKIEWHNLMQQGTAN